jgi:hypothetical protein
VFLDGTLSMQGFVRAGPGTRYEQVLQGLERALVSGWPHSQIKFHRFGTKLDQIPTKPVNALQPKFYSDRNFSDTTNIDLPLAEAAPGQMVFIITDLFEDQSDVARLVRALKEHVLSRLAVGIIGVRSKFNGEIYDITPAGYHLHHNGLRPFYILAIGSTMDVVRYFQEFSRTLGLLPPDAQMVLLAPSPVAAPFKFSSDRDRDHTHTSRPLRIDRLVGGADVLGLQFPKHGRGNPQFTVAMPVALLPYGLLLEPRLLDTQVRCSFFNESPLQRSPGVLKVSSSSIKELSLKLADVKTGEEKPNISSTVGARTEALLLSVSFDRSRLTHPGIYMYDIRVFCPRSAVSLPEWINDWSIDLRSLQNAIAKKRFDGTKTLNLFQLVDDTYSSMFRILQPEIGRVYIYLDVE